MRLLRHWKMIIGLLAIFGAGVGTGAIGTVITLHRVFTKREPQGQWVNARLSDLERHLKLTPEQQEKVRPMVQKAGQRFRAIGTESFEKIIDVANETHEEVARELTPEQREEFNRLRPHVIARLRELAQREIAVRANQLGLPPASAPARDDAKPKGEADALPP